MSENFILRSNFEETRIIMMNVAIIVGLAFGFVWRVSSGATGQTPWMRAPCVPRRRRACSIAGEEGGGRYLGGSLPGRPAVNR